MVPIIEKIDKENLGILQCGAHFEEIEEENPRILINKLNSIIINADFVIYYESKRLKLLKVVMKGNNHSVNLVLVGC